MARHLRAWRTGCFCRKTPHVLAFIWFVTQSYYAPEHNPDEFLNNDLKQAMARRRTPRDKAALKSGLTSYMRSLQRCPAKVRTFFQAPTVRYAA